MLPSTSSSSAAPSHPAPVPAPALAFTPASAAAPPPPPPPHTTTTTTTITTSFTADPGLVLHQRTPGATPAIAAVPAVPYPLADPGPVPATADLGQQKRRPSSSLDDRARDSSSDPLPGGGDNVSAIPRDQRTKKRRTGPGTRGVANLTPEQLLKKRANDREAQRAIRERTKNQIEALENRIKELTSQDPYRELQEAVRQKEAVEAQNAELRNHLASIAATIQHLLSGNTASLVPTHKPTPAAQPQHLLISHDGPRGGSESTLSPGAGLPWSPLLHGQPGSLSHSSSLEDQISLQQPHRVVSLNIGGVHLNIACLFPDTEQDPAYQGDPPKQELSGPTRLKHEYHNTPHSTSSLPSPTQQSQYTYHSSNSPASPQSPWRDTTAPIGHLPSTCPVDSLLLGFMAEYRQRNAGGISIQGVEESKYLSVSSLLNPSNSSHLQPLSTSSNTSHFQPLSTFLTDILSKFTGLAGIPEKMAILYVMFRMLRWQIDPTQENYDLLPPYSRPLKIQYNKPHPAWVDYMPFPKMREKFVEQCDSPDFQFEAIFFPYMQSLSLNWPYEESEALVEAGDGSGLLFDPIFQDHILRIENWTLDDVFDRACPILRGLYNLKNDSSALVKKEGKVVNDNNDKTVGSQSGHI